MQQEIRRDGWDPLNTSLGYHCTMFRSASKPPFEIASPEGRLLFAAARCKVPCHFTSIPMPNPSKPSCRDPGVNLLQGHSATPSGPASKNSTPRNGYLRHNARDPQVHFHILQNLSNKLFSLFFFFFKEPARLGILKVLLHYCKIQEEESPQGGETQDGAPCKGSWLSTRRSVPRLSNHHGPLAGKSHPPPTGLGHPNFLSQGEKNLTFPTLKWCDEEN